MFEERRYPRGFPNPYRDGPADVYWIAGPLDHERHAVAERPGAWPAGWWVSALCGAWTTIPTATPYGREPASAAITDQCPLCGELAQSQGRCGVVWDF